VAGEITSVSPLALGAERLALGYVKRGVESLFVRTDGGSAHPVQVLV
jgi:hypothetical protein